MLGRLAFALAMFAAVAFSVAAAAPLGPQGGTDTGDGTVTLVKGSKGGSGGKGGGKGGSGKGGKHHHRHRGGGIYIDAGYCAITAASCADRYRRGSRRYYWCLRNAGC